MELTIQQAKDLIKQNNNNSNFELIDVRTPQEYEEGHIENAINIPMDKIPHQLNNFTNEKKYLLYCRTDGRSRFTSNFLKQHGIQSDIIIGGYIEWMINE